MIPALWYRLGITRPYRARFSHAACPLPAAYQGEENSRHGTVSTVTIL